MFLDAEMQLAYKVGNTPFNMFPYPHFYVPDVFPADFYQTIQQNLPDPQAMAAPAEWPAMTAGVRFICSSRARKPSAMPCKDRLSFAPRLLNAWPGKSGAMTSKKGLSKGSRPRQLKLPEPVPCKSKRQGPWPQT